jgi:hypothetical protein
VPEGPDRDARKAEDSGWEREHAVDYADFLDALLDQDDPLHAVATRAVETADEEWD